ncbi:hypothetical protein FRC14_008234 [Serendipita sp. 396]|nr:hypothetical protein FRC14_008234 [Serendipita sp. 396]KAG8786049.1 hypothetical protein FRC15_000202 [Serendipita sp. 397]KAG8792608.1 hypothetical protein FRC16_011339 [Serendipita sp. 398]KAG8830006.1 hypothetical protein FRC18_008757 [Serendipita sp. 400]KAG8842886.1 hypothetical protein FRB91_003863 [Serendipita sp. 411]KAG8862030.1 hypothetical protein FRC20_011405 [Serendipita sp. 405]
MAAHQLEGLHRDSFVRIIRGPKPRDIPATSPGQTAESWPGPCYQTEMSNLVKSTTNESDEIRRGFDTYDLVHTRIGFQIAEQRFNTVISIGQWEAAFRFLCKETKDFLRLREPEMERLLLSIIIVRTCILIMNKYISELI